MLIKAGVLVAAALAASVAAAQDMKAIALANELGSLLASEALCELSYDQAAIAAFVEKRVKPDDMSFTNNLRMMTGGQEIQLKSLTASGKTAHCTQIKRVAKSYGFTR
ncbi:signal recognition particle [Bosea sp. FBZP-16]|uniref:signal recognition particle n=1 Tax=Bosea sp. FBZP-16 TaxID=2065382 RepID=UPI000C302E15|nr:signal recognition particle [Bosea sp. FBZP-16]